MNGQFNLNRQNGVDLTLRSLQPPSALPRHLMTRQQVLHTSIAGALALLSRAVPMTASPILQDKEQFQNVTGGNKVQPNIINQLAGDDEVEYLSVSDLDTLTDQEIYVLETNERTQEGNMVPDDYPLFVRSKFNIKVIGDDYVVQPTGIITKDYKEGTGPYPQEGDHIVFECIGRNESGVQIINTVRLGKPSECDLGEYSNLVEGFDLALRGMRAGGERRVIIPPSLGPPTGPSTFFSAKQVEVFDIQMVSITRK